MYRKRTFAPPLHNVRPPQPAAPDPAAAKAAAAPSAPPPAAEGKENATPVDDAAAEEQCTAAMVPAAKKPRLFVRPAPSASAAAAGAAAGGSAPSAAAAAAAASLTANLDASSAPPVDTPTIISVLYCNANKFRKKAERGYQDGILKLNAAEKTATLLDADGKVVTKGKAKVPKGAPLESGALIEVGNWCCEVDQFVALDDFKRGTCFATQSAPATTSMAAQQQQPTAAAAFKPLKRPGSLLHQGLSGSRSAAAAGAGAGGGGPGLASGPAGLFDPAAPGAVLVNGSQWQDGKGVTPSGRPVVPVVIDPYLGRHLRPHQCEGVRFMYECVMGLRSAEHHGCLLADEMGLGKTLQVLTLMWTLLRQGPEGGPVLRKAIVVAPATLVNNWAKEAKSWLGVERLRFIVLPQGPTAADAVQDFKQGKVWSLLIASYEAMRKFGATLSGCCDLLICDEGHRLKAKGGNKTIEALLALNCARRVVLTGTPVQNRLDEFYALLSFAVPGLLGPFASFNSVYGAVITRAQDKDASAEDKELGAVRADELHRRVSGFMLRRTQEVLSKHLPPLSVHTLFCKPAALQVEVYRALLRSQGISSILYGRSSGDGDGCSVLPAITVLKKLCNHPALLHAEGVAGALQQPAPQQQQQAPGQRQPPQQAPAKVKVSEVAAALLEQHAPGAGLPLTAPELSGKLLALSTLLAGVIAEGSRVVVVSTSTSALDLIDQVLCGPAGWRSVRIDGGTSVDERQATVDNFNTRGIGQVFLLSTRAGGAGLNLIGANHLVLFDCDWNPAADLQAMARIWRHGQKKPCFVTRLVTAGTIEEKIYQRQLSKSDLADATMQGGGGVSRLSHDELKQLFQLDLGPECSTRKLLESGKAVGSVTWLGLQQGDQLPPALAAAVRTGVVTAANREQPPGAAAAADAAAACGQQDGVAAAAAAAGPSAAAAVAPAAGGDVDELEVEDDD